jgi:hypothetical protein
MLVTREPDGRVLRIGAQMGTVRANPPGGWLVDASALGASPVALELSWPDDADPFRAQVRVEASNDLRTWTLVDPSAALLDLRQGARRLAQRRIALSATGRYYRVVPTGERSAASLAVQSVHAILPSLPIALDWQWREDAGTRSDEDGAVAFAFELDGRFPVRQVDVALGGNHAVRWRLYSRERSDAPWQLRAGPWMAYRLASDGGASRSPPRQLPAVVRDRHWRLVAEGPVRGTPRLRWGYRPDVLMFVAQGEPPFKLVAGSANARRSEAALPALVEALRSERGAGWKAPVATLGESTRLAGDAAYREAAAPRDWRRFTLWGVLLLATVVVAGFALSLLRAPRSPQS